MTDPVGQLTTETAYSGGAAYTTQQKGFNGFGESLGETITIPSSAEGSVLGTSYTFGHTYGTVTGRPASDSYPSAGGLPAGTVNHGYATDLDLPTTIGEGLTGFAQGVTYDAYGRVNQETIGMGANLAYLTDKYDVHTGNLTDQLVTRAVATPAAVDEQAYSYDPAGNITAQASTRLGSSASSETQCFNYDQLDRLSMAWTATDSCAATPSSSNSSTVGDNLGASSAYWTSWSYDALGNRTSQVQHSTTGGTDTTTSYTYNGDGASQPGTLTSTSGGSAGSTSYGYDATGNMTTRNAGQGTQALSWNDAGQLTAITGGTGGGSHYVYDAGGNLLLQKDPGATTLYLPGEQITLNTTTQATTGVRYYPLPGGGVAYRTGAGTSYGFEITDQHGTAVLTLDNTAQTPTWRQLTPYGAPRGTAVTWADNRGFLNKPTDTNTGLTIIGARQYDPTAGRFISLDPLLEATSPQELGGYTYAADNPITNSDPTGLHNLPPPGESGCPSSEPGCPGYRGPGGPTAGAGGGQDSPVPSPGVGSRPTARHPSPQPGPVALPPPCIGRGCERAELAPAGPSPFLDLLRDVGATVLSCAMRINDGRCPLRMPDYYSFNYSGTPLMGLPIVVSVNVTITRHGNVFYGGSAGFGPPGFSGAVRGGYIDQPHVPSPSEVRNFVHGPFVSGELTPSVYPAPLIGGIGPSAAETWGSPYPPHGGTHNFATEVGVGFNVDEPGTLTGGYDWGGWRLP